MNRLHTVNPILLYFLLLFSQHVNELFCTPYSYRVAEDGLSYWPGYREVLRDNFQMMAWALPFAFSLSLPNLVNLTSALLANELFSSQPNFQLLT